VKEQGRLKGEIRKLLRERNAVMLAHNYQRDEIQEIADITGDSLGLSQEAAKCEAEVIVFCGVHFMAESAAILSPDKTVLLPRMEAGCPMADMITADDLRAYRAAHPGAVVVTYVNSSAEVKALSDICCTSGNAVNVVRSIPDEREIYMVPDRNLAHYVAKMSGRRLTWWDGYCPTHERLTIEATVRARAAHPGAVSWCTRNAPRRWWRWPTPCFRPRGCAPTAAGPRRRSSSSARRWGSCTASGRRTPARRFSSPPARSSART